MSEMTVGSSLVLPAIKSLSTLETGRSSYSRTTLDENLIICS